MRHAWVFAVLVISGCGRERGVPARGPNVPLSRTLMTALDAGAVSSTVHDAGTDGTKRGARGLALQLKPWPAPEPSPSPHVEILSPFAEQHLALARAARSRVALKVEHWPDSGVELALDAFRPRRVSTLQRPLRLGSLVPADRDLRAGEHLLVAIAVRPDGRTVKPVRASSLQPFAAVRFWVGPRGTPSIDLKKPMLVYSEPRGTYNGASAADGAFIDYYLLNGQLGPGKLTVSCTVKHSGASRLLLLHRWQASKLRGLQNGDYTIELMLIGPDGKPLRSARTSAHRTITVNRDAPMRLPAAFRFHR